jgi:hypothetical protein
MTNHHPNMKLDSENKHQGKLSKKEEEIYKILCIKETTVNDEKDSDSKKRKTQTSQRTLDSMYGRGSRRLKQSQVLRSEDIDYAFVEWLVLSGRPSNIRDDKPFQRFLNKLNSRYKLPSRKKITVLEKDVLYFILSEVQESLNRSARYFTKSGKVFPFISVQFDGWTSLRNITFLGIIISYFDPFMDDKVDVVLAIYEMPRGKAAVDLAEILKDVFTAYDIEEAWLYHSVTDGEGAVTNASSFCNSNIVHELCRCHDLQTLIKHATGMPSKLYKTDPFEDGNEFFNKIRSVVSLFTTGSQKLKLLKRLQNVKEVNVVGKVVSSDDTTEVIEQETEEGIEEDSDQMVQEWKRAVGILKFQVTRWGSVNKVLNRFLRVQDALNEWFEMEEQTNREQHEDALSSDDWKNCEQIAALLYPLDYVNTIMQTQHKVVSSYAFFLMQRVLSFLEAAKSKPVTVIIGESKEAKQVTITTPLAKETLSRLDAGMRERYDKPSEQDLVLMLLDPRLKYYISNKYKGGMYKNQAVSAVLDLLRMFVDTGEGQASSITHRSRGSTRAPCTKNGSGGLFGISDSDESDDEEHSFQNKETLLEDVFKKLEEQLNLYLSLKTPKKPDFKPQEENQARKQGEEKSKGKDKVATMDICPYQWWKATVDRHPDLRCIADLARMLLAHPRTSSVSEFIFSYGGAETNGKRSSLSAERLNARELIKFNHRLINAGNWDLIAEKQGELRKWAIKGFGLKKNLSVNKTYLKVAVTCAYCINTSLDKTKCTSRYAGAVSCDNFPNCERDTRDIPENEFFYACKSCDEYDLCIACYNIYEVEAKNEKRKYGESI